MGYIPPVLRDDPNYKPKKLSYKPELKTKEQLLEEYSKTNQGKADDAWDN